MTINLIGNFCILTALGASGIGFLLAWVTDPWVKKESSLLYIRRLATINFFLMTAAVTVMVYALLADDFSVSYVAHVGARETPRFFAAISLWSSLEGSILLWGWILSGYTALCAYRYRDRFPELMPSVFLFLFAIGIFFYLVLAIPANPFQSVNPIPENGPGPNPLLQNHWLMGFHPPMLYLGYVGMSVPFSFAMASLITGRLSNEWVTVTRRWFLAAWTFLTVAIVLGAWWSYAVLGWGGYWAWDPVENASFMPWLVGTAFLHSIMVEERRQMLKIWNLSLIVVTFLLTLLGTFLTRSGILDSVHSFTESGIGHYFLICISTVLIASVALLIWKGSRFKSLGRFDAPICRESAFLLANLLFVCFCFVVLLGTLYPLIVEAIRGSRISVGQPFFNQMALPLGLLILLLMGIGVLLPWGKASLNEIGRSLRLPILVGLGGTALAFELGIKKIFVLISLGVVLFAFSIMLFEVMTLFWKNGSGAWRKLFIEKPRRYGGFIAHIGVLVLVLGITFSGNYQRERQVSLKLGEMEEIGPYQVKLANVFGNNKPQRFELIADMLVLKKERPIDVMQPQLNFYANNREPTASPAIRSSLFDDLYITFMSFDHEAHLVTLRILLTPMVSWIWAGGGIIALGVWVSSRSKKVGA